MIRMTNKGGQELIRLGATFASAPHRKHRRLPDVLFDVVSSRYSRDDSFRKGIVTSSSCPTSSSGSLQLRPLLPLSR